MDELNNELEENGVRNDSPFKMYSNVADQNFGSDYDDGEEDDEFYSGADFNEEEPNTAQNLEDEKDSEKEKEKEEEEKAAESVSKSSEHDGKYFVIQKGKCQCDQGFKFPKFKVTSHQKHYWNSGDGKADFLAVTEDDLILDPPAMPFGQCKLKPSSGGYLPCSYAPVGKWQKPYEKVKVMGHSCLTEISELKCAVGGKITILKHGQQSEAGKSNVATAKTEEQQIYNPIIDFDEFKEEINPDEFEVE